MKKRAITTAIAIAAVLHGAAQRNVTPVETDDKKPQQPTLHYYDKHGEPLKEPVLFIATLDTVAKARSGPKYPLLYGMGAGVNIFDAVMLAAGQKYAGFDASVYLSLHNWFFPTVEAGIGFANSSPADKNFTYRCKPSPYVKLGLDYNFLYKSNPDYRAVLGVRACYSGFRYSVDNVSINSGYWDETQRFDISGQKAHAFYGEVLAGVQVKIVRHLSLAWTARIHFKMKTSSGSNSTPWYIPGYGATSPLSATFSVIYTIPFGRSKAAETSVADD